MFYISIFLKTEDCSVGLSYMQLYSIIYDSMVCAYGDIILVEHHFFVVWPIYL